MFPVIVPNSLKLSVRTYFILKKSATTVSSDLIPTFAELNQPVATRAFLKHMFSR
jgi:hypothetical protein